MLGGDRKWKHWLVQPEGRYWFGSAFKGHYVGVHLHGGQMNLGHVALGIMRSGSITGRGGSTGAVSATDTSGF